jgi:hypothetical protein
VILDFFSTSVSCTALNVAWIYETSLRCVRKKTPMGIQRILLSRVREKKTLPSPGSTPWNAWTGFAATERWSGSSKRAKF